jgi:threonine synthase
MAHPTALGCVRCGKRLSLTDFARDCPDCRAAGTPANLTVAYERVGESVAREQLFAARGSMWRFEAFLPASRAEAITLGEGNTPLLAVERLGLGRLLLKDESRNPTWSFKDRLASAAVTMATKLGAKVVASSSSGNAGAATAAYAARAGLPCIICTFASAAGPLVAQMRAYGALVLTVENKDDRWKVISGGVREWGWYPITVFFGPAVGSNPYGIEGYKTIAYELVAELGDAPQWCVLPVCYGDALYGMWKGFEELRALGWTSRSPRMVAAEVSGSLAAAMASGAEMPPARPREPASIAASIGAIQGTVQGLIALRASNGIAQFVADDELLAWQRKLAAQEGVFVEPSAAATFPVIQKLRGNGTMRSDDTVVALVTAGGLKDYGPLEGRLPALPRVTGDLVTVAHALHNAYGYRAGS